MVRYYHKHRLRKISPPPEPQPKSNWFLSYFKKDEITKEPTRIQNTLENLRKINELKIKDTITVWEKVYNQAAHIAGTPPISIPDFDGIKKLTNKKDVSKAFEDWIEQNKNNLAFNNLNLADSELHFLPKQLFNLTQLQILSLWGNSLTSIPKEIGNLSQLQFLDLALNNLSHYPKCLDLLTNTRVLGINILKVHEILRFLGGSLANFIYDKTPCFNKN